MIGKSSVIIGPPVLHTLRRRIPIKNRRSHICPRLWFLGRHKAIFSRRISPIRNSQERIYMIQQISLHLPILCLGDGDSVKVTQLDEELGHVGLAQPGSPKLINTLLEGGFLPVVSSIGVTEEGELMNVNADQAATALAATLGADLILLSDVSGILDGKGQRIAEMTAEKAEQLIAQGIITDGMIVKVNAALDAARTLGRPVDIASWRHAEQLPALFNGTPIGTRILA